MLRRFQYVNIPTEVLRAFACIVEHGSFSKAAERLNLSQPAISAQIKKLQVMVGGTVFERAGGGVDLTERGKLLLPMVRRMLEINDQILQIGSAAHSPRPVRIGLSFAFGDPVLQKNDPQRLKGVSVFCDHSPDLMRSLSDGYVDVCAVYRPSDTMGRVVKRWTEQLVWVRSRDFTLSPGAPVPLVGRLGAMFEQIAIGLVGNRGLSYRLAFNSIEQASRVSAVRAGLGVMLVPEWAIPEDLVVASEYYLPPPQSIEAGIMVGETADKDGTRRALELLEVLVR